FLVGFASGAVGQAAGMLSEGSPLAGIGGMEGRIARSIFAGAAGGAASELTGGKFVNGFVTAAFAHAWNQEGIGHNGGPPLGEEDEDEYSFSLGYPFDHYGDIRIYDIVPYRLGIFGRGPGIAAPGGVEGVGVGNYAGESIPARSA